MACPGPRPGRRTGAAHRRRRARLCCRDAATGPAPALRAQLPDALRRAGADPVDRARTSSTCRTSPTSSCSAASSVSASASCAPGPGSTCSRAPRSRWRCSSCSSACSRSRSSATGNAGIIFFGSGRSSQRRCHLGRCCPIVFLAVAAVMAMIGEGVARTFVTFRPLDAYRLDIARQHRRHRGLLGAVVPRRQAGRLGRSSWPWSCSLLYGSASGCSRSSRSSPCWCCCSGRESLSSSDIWSPYYRISVQATRRTASTADQRQRHAAPDHHPGAPAARSVYSQPYLRRSPAIRSTTC